MSRRSLCVPAADPEALKVAADTISGGGIVAFPTETFYGLGARFDDEEALKRLYTIKKRPIEKTFPLIIGRPCRLALVSRRVSRIAYRIIQRYWPGPLTLLLPAAEGLSPFIVRDGKVAVRIPGPSFSLALSRLCPFPITSTSANISQKPPAGDASAVSRYFRNAVDLVIDGGNTGGALPSTIVDLSQGSITIVRKGAVGIISLS